MLDDEYESISDTFNLLVEKTLLKRKDLLYKESLSDEETKDVMNVFIDSFTTVFDEWKKYNIENIKNTPKENFEKYIKSLRQTELLEVSELN